MNKQNKKETDEYITTVNTLVREDGKSDQTFGKIMEQYRDYEVIVVIGKNVFNKGTSILCSRGKYANPNCAADNCDCTITTCTDECKKQHSCAFLRMLTHGIFSTFTEKAPSLIQRAGRFAGSGHQYIPKIYLYAEV